MGQWNSLAGLCPGIGSEQIDFAATAAGGDDHAIACAELHFPRRKIGHADDQPADELFRLVDALDAGEDRAALFAAEAERELEQLLSTGHVFGLDDPHDAQIDLGEIVEADGFGQRLGEQRAVGVEGQCCGGRFSLGRLSAGGHHRLDLFGIDSLHHVRKLADRSAQQRLLGLLPAFDLLAEQFAGLFGQIAATPAPDRRPIAGRGSSRSCRRPAYRVSPEHRPS